MSQTHYEEIVNKIHSLQNQLKQEFDQLVVKNREAFQYKVKKGKVIFDKSAHDFHQKYRVNVWTYIKEANLLYILTSPFIYSVIFPLVFLDLAVFIYQQICFRVYGIPIVTRSNYIVIDRQHLAYLNAIEKINCIYCGYGNGLIAYIGEIFARTEQFWCPIKHAKRSLNPHHYVDKFVDYGDVTAYKQQLALLRKELREIKDQ